SRSWSRCSPSSLWSNSGSMRTMSSFISSSDVPRSDPESPMWRRWYGACFAVSASALVMLYFAVLLLDPFSTGRFTPIDRVDIATRVPQYANAGRVRDPQFDAAMIANSHALTINPRNLSAAPGRRFVLLAAAGSLPPHLLTVARAFQQHHRAGSSVVLMLDDFWCFAQGEARPYPFPTWLYVSPTG